MGAALFQIPAKDTLELYTPPIILLSLGLSLTGTFLNHKFSTNRETRYKPRPVKSPLTPIETGPFVHTLVPGGKEAEDPYSKTLPGSPSANTSAPATVQSHFEDMKEKPVSPWSVGKWGARHDLTPLRGPPDKLEARIDAFSFSCQECGRTIVLPWEKVKATIGNEGLRVDCPHCHRQYPLDYERTQRKTLCVTFHGIIRREDQSRDKPTGFPIPEHEAKIENVPTIELETQAITLAQEPEIPAIASVQRVATAGLNSPFVEIPPPQGLSENRVGEAARAIRNSSRVLVGSLVNNRLFQTMASRFQPSGRELLSQAPIPDQFTHILVPGGKEGESLSQVIPVVPSKWSAGTDGDALGPLHGTFEDMPNGNKPASTLEQSYQVKDSTVQMGPPDQLGVHVESFLFNCQDCDRPIGIPWTKVEAGLSTSPFTVDCANCNHQFLFNYEQAKRKTLALKFSMSLGETLPEPPSRLGQGANAIESTPVQQTTAIVPAPKYAIMALPKNAIVALRKYAIVALPRKANQESKTDDQTVAHTTRYSPGLAYDRAILERG